MEITFSSTHNAARRWTWAVCLMLTFAALFIHGYHPYAEDAGIYIPAIKKQLDPSLYPVGSELFTLPARFSVFTRALSASVRLTHLPLSYALLLWYWLALFSTILACWRIAEQVLPGKSSGLVGASLIAAVISMPAAGCALLLSDPYLTSRSVSTPLLLFSVAYILAGRRRAAMLCWLAAFSFHPLMGAIGGLFLVMFLIARTPKWRQHVTAIVIANVVSLLVLASINVEPVSADYRAAVMSRSYFFLSGWAWYELVGAVSPLVIFAWLALRTREMRDTQLVQLSWATVAFGTWAIATAATMTWIPGLFAFGRLQPMRAFQLIYILMFLLPINFALQWISRNWASRRREIAFATIVFALSVGMYEGQRQTFASTQHIEWPWSTSENAWQAAFDWIRVNTPKDAVFALNPDYTNAPGDDHQGFRAEAERSALPDRTKDGGVAALFPELASNWKTGTDLTSHLDRIDQNGIAALLNAGATWVVVSAGSVHVLNCPYANSALAVCQLAPTVELARRKPGAILLSQKSVR